MKRLFVIVFCVFVAITACNRNQDDSSEDQPREGLNTKPDTVVIDTVVTKQPSDSLAKEKTEADLKTNKATEEFTENLTFYVIVGSFKDDKNAEMLKKQLSKNGFPSEILDPVNAFKRVSVKTFKTRADAEKELERVKTVEKRLDAWILTK